MRESTQMSSSPPEWVRLCRSTQNPVVADRVKAMAAPRKACIVSVEDNPADVFLIRLVLREQGVPFSLVHLTDGEDAVKTLMGMELPDLILLDVSLPLMNGFEVLKRLRQEERFSRVPIAMLTSSDSPRDRWNAERHGATRYVVKMTNLDAFRTEVGTAVNEMLQRSPLPIERSVCGGRRDSETNRGRTEST